MIRMQIVERPGMDLYRVLKRAIRSKDLRTFSLERHGARVVHNRYPGFMKWTAVDGAIACEIRAPVVEEEWQLLSAVVGMLARRFPAAAESIHVQLIAPPAVPVKRKRRKRK
jgi:hypothetical protein